MKAGYFRLADLEVSCTGFVFVKGPHNKESFVLCQYKLFVSFCVQHLFTERILEVSGDFLRR